jgi:two-component system response regulator HydG
MLDVLVVDDDDDVREGVARALANAGHQVTEASDGEKALSLIDARPFDVAICDVRMPRVDGLMLLRRLRREAPGTSVVMMTSFASIPDVVGSIRDGAVNYVTKPFDPEDFVRDVVGPLAEKCLLRKSFELARTQAVGREAGGTFIGTSLTMRQLADRAATVARGDASVLITGERGTGKKLMARTIHAESPRRDGPLVIVPCATLADLMLESELRGLDGAVSENRRDAWFRAAQGGTLVLDGIDLLPVGAQGSLLRTIDEPGAHARRSSTWQPLGVRLISLARESLVERVAARRFLESLMFRLNTVQLRIPPLRQRDGELYSLVSHFLRQATPPSCVAAGLTPRAWKALAGYPFPGNVRELAWALEQALAVADGGEIDREHLPPEVVAPQDRSPK